MLSDAGLLAAFALLILAPGFLLERALLPLPAAPPLVRLALWLGLSLSIVPLLFLWLTVAGAALLPPLPGLIGGLLAAASLLRLSVDLRRGEARRRAAASLRSLFSILTLLIFLVTLAVRFVQIDGLALPAWVDSLHHALLIRVAAERGQAPLSLQPYLPVEALPYHWGYHAFSALALGVAGAELPGAVPQAMLWHGQLLGALIVPACAGLAAHLWRRPLPGVVAGLVAGLLSVMPAYYVSWGRYTLLAGVVMLPAALIALDAALRSPSRGRIAAAALLLAGVSLVHFVVFVFALAWGCAVVAVAAPGEGWRSARSLAIVGVAAAALTAPWLALLAGQALPGAGMSARHVAGNSTYNAMPYALLWASNNRALLALAAAGGLLGCLRRRRAAPQILTWSLAATLLANPPLLGLPYLSFVTNETLAITLFLPAALLIGGGAGALDEWARARLPGRRAGRLYEAALVAGVLALAGLGAWQSRQVIRADTVLATADDLAAIRWAAANTPPDARFVVNTAGWLDDVNRGADGGWWLLPLAGREVSTPPVLYTYGPDSYVARVKRESAWLRDAAAPDPAALAAFMRDNGYTHVFATAEGSALSIGRLRGAPLFEELYANGSAAIFRLR